MVRFDRGDADISAAPTATAPAPIPPEPNAAESAVGTGTRYVGPVEAQVIQDTGMVPNTNAVGDPKTIFYTPDAPLGSASAAQKAYNLPTTPTNVVTLDPSGIQNVYGGNVENGTGIELGTRQAMPGSDVHPLKP